MQVAAIVLVTDPDRVPSAPVETLRALYRLPPREAELTLALADGSSLLAVAERLALGEATARGYLTAIYRKTGTTPSAAVSFDPCDGSSLRHCC